MSMSTGNDGRGLPLTRLGHALRKSVQGSNPVRWALLSQIPVWNDTVWMTGEKVRLRVGSTQGSNKHSPPSHKLANYIYVPTGHRAMSQLFYSRDKRRRWERRIPTVGAEK